VASLSAVLAHHLWERLVVWLFHADEPLVHLTYAGTRPVDQWWNAANALVLVIWTGLALTAIRQAHDRAGTLFPRSRALAGPRFSRWRKAGGAR
jgi:hypothetical protein